MLCVKAIVPDCINYWHRKLVAQKEITSSGIIVDVTDCTVLNVQIFEVRAEQIEVLSMAVPFVV
jgi:hypothetical protein